MGTAKEGFEPDQGVLAKAVDEDDVEGHAMTREGFAPKPPEGFGVNTREGFANAKAVDEDDVEGHGFSVGPRNRGE